MTRKIVLLDARANRGCTEIESRDVDFLENNFSSKPEVQKSSELYKVPRCHSGFVGNLLCALLCG